MILKVENIAKAFGKKKVLTNVSLEMKPSCLFGIVGENGSGKSTLLKIIIGEWKADKGKIFIDGRIGYCPQKISLFTHLTVEENFRYFAAAYEIDWSVLKERSESLMNFFKFSRFRKEKVANLSGGTQQKLNLSIALLHKPNLLILDEPYSGFDWDTYLKFWDYANNLRDEGCAILIVTHFLNETHRFDSIYNLKEGELV